MSPNEINSNLSSVGTKQDDLDLNKMMQDSSNAELIDNPQAQQNRLFGLLKRSIKDFSMWPAEKQILVVSAAGGLLATALPLLLAAVPLAATGAMIGLALFFSVKAVQSGYKGLEWSAKKTVEGAKDLYGKAKDGAVHAKNKAKEGVSFVAQTTREGTSSALKTMGDSVQKLGRKMSNTGAGVSDLDRITDSIELQSSKVVLKTEGKTKNFNSVKEMFVKEVFKDKTVNSSTLTKKIFSELQRIILQKGYSVDGPQGFKKDQLINQLRQQADFVSKLDDEKLQNLLAKDNNSLYEIFSEYHDEIKEIIKECKKEHARFNTLERLNKSAKRHKTSSINSLENSFSRSSSMSLLNSNSTDSSTAGLLNSGEHKGVKPTTSLRNKLQSWLGGRKAPEEAKKATNVEYQTLESDAMSPERVGNGAFYGAGEGDNNKTATLDPTRLRRNSLSSTTSEPKEVAPPRVFGTLTRSGSVNSSTSTSSSFSYQNGPDSGMGSGSSTPERKSLSLEDLNQSKLKKTGLRDKLVPSSKVAVDTDVQQQAAQTAVERN